jgi:hypothetical protein
MKITIEQTVKNKTEVDVNFPIYRKQWLDNSTIYMKVESLDRQVNIHLYDDENKVELEVDKPSFWGSREYLLGEGEHESNKDEFKDAVTKLKSLANCC